MNFKKIVCGLLSFNIVFAPGTLASATSMKKILEDMHESGYFGKNENLDKIMERTLTFLREERKKKLSLYDHASERSDSLAFTFFCYLCICKRGGKGSDIDVALAKVCGSRNAKEHIEDMAVINDILPQNSSEFAARFGIWTEESKRRELAEYVSKSSYRGISQDEDMPEFSYDFAENSRRKERKPDRKLREAMREGMELAEEYYDDEEYDD